MPSNHSNGNSSLEIAQSSQDLIIAKGKRKKRAYIIGAITGLIVLGLVIALVVVLTTKSNDPEVVESAVNLENFLEGKLSPKSFNASWSSNNALFYRDESGSIVLYNVATRSTDIVLPNTWTYLMNGFNYQLSPDEKYLLIARDYQKLYRYTYSAKYTVVDLNSRREVSVGGDDAVLQYCTWAPTGNAIAFVSNNNIYYKPTAFDNEVVVTEDGQEGHIYNGVPDWVYEEEVFGSDHAMWFSNDGKKLAYIRFDDRTTEIMTIPYYGIPGSLDSQYTKAVQIRYPKPGTTNPKISLHVYNVEAGTMDLETPTDLNDPIITTVSWATNVTVVATWLNRVQNEASLVSYDTTTYTSVSQPQLISHIKQENGWLELFTNPIFSKDGSQFLLILSQDQGGDAGSYRHITRYNVAPNSDGVAVTRGKFVVTEILGWNDDTIFYLATTPEDPAVQHLYNLSVSSGESTCISCDIKTSVKEEDCLYNSAKFSSDFTYYVFNCAGPGFPEISVFSADHQKLMVWEDNADLIEMLDKEYYMPKIQRLEFNISEDFKAQVLLKLPPNMDMSGNTKYPMVVNVYGGPDSYQVLEKFSVDWGSYLAVNKSIIYATIDGRLSGLKGDKILFSGYRNLGTVEVEDQVSVTKQIQQTVPYIDGTRTAIWGWSYGGYAAGLALATDTESIFKCAMSVAPITDWTLYDSIYTERFMGLPTANDNGDGYENAKLLTKFNGIRDKEYFLIHGTFDDNVHYQQSMLWSKVLEHQDVLFRQQSYADEDHSLASVRPHLYHSLENFLDECFIENVEH